MNLTHRLTMADLLDRIPHFVSSHDFHGDAVRQEKLHQLGADLQFVENRYDLRHTLLIKMQKLWQRRCHN